MDPITIGVLASAVVAGIVAVGSLIASVCTYFSFKDSASASSADEQCVKVHNEVKKTDKNGNIIEKKQDISIHNTCLESMQRSTSIQMPVNNETANKVGSGATNALGGIAGGLGGGGGAPTDILSQVTGLATNIASNATKAKQNVERYAHKSSPKVETKNQILEQKNTSSTPTYQQQEEAYDDSHSNELELFDKYGRKVHLEVTQNGSDIEVNLYHDNSAHNNPKNNKGKERYYSKSDSTSSSSAESGKSYEVIDIEEINHTTLTKTETVLDITLVGTNSTPLEESA